MSSHFFRFNLEGPDLQRSPLLEGLLARADASHDVHDWRADAYRLIAGEAPMPSVAAAALCAEDIAPAGSSVYLATPVHYAAGMSSVRLAPDGILTLQAAEPVSLAEDFNRIWHDAGVRLFAARSSRLYLISERSLVATTDDPQRLRGRLIDDFVPRGSDAKRLRALMSEIEMWLFGHPVNRTRPSDSTISGLWLWGGGGLIRSLPCVSGWSLGHDVFFESIGASAVRTAAAAGVAVTDAQPGSSGWTEAEQWLAESAADCRAGRVARLELCAGERRVSVPAGRWRWWRRKRAWWEHFA